MGKSFYRLAYWARKRIALKLGFCRRSPFLRFEENINSVTWLKHDELLQWADRLAEGDILDTAEYRQRDEVTLLGLALRQECLNHFKDKLKEHSELRVLVHVPSMRDSPGGASVFSNLVNSLRYIGIETFTLPWEHNNISELLDHVRPNVLLTSDHESYLRRIDWSAISKYREKNLLKIGLTASLQEYGNTPLEERLQWSRTHNINFFYSFRSAEYVKIRKEYEPFFASGYEIHSVEFGANILAYYPVPGVTRDIDFVFFASSNPDKWPRYFEYLTRLLAKHPGFLDGPGWTKNVRWANQASHRYLYARAKVGLNLHIQDSIDWPSELNERTYILAACGVPQLIDNPKLLSKRFRLSGMFVAKDAKQYEELFEYMLNHSFEAKSRARVAMEDVYTNHTTFHRAEALAKALSSEITK